MSDVQITTKQAGFKPYPQHGGSNLAVLPQGTRIQPDTEWIYGVVLDGPYAGEKGFLPAALLVSEPPPPPPAIVNPSGIAMPGDTLAGWKQVFAEDFRTDFSEGDFPGPYQGRLTGFLTGWPDTTGHGYADRGIVSVAHDCLCIRIHGEDGKFHVMTITPVIQPAPAGVRQGGGRDFGVGLRYGRYDICARMSRMPGYKTAWLLWPDVPDNYTPQGGSPQNRAGEIDWPEGNLDATTIGAYMHRPFTGTTLAGQDAFHAHNVDRTQWHVYTTEWLPDRVTFYLDGVKVGESTQQIPHVPMHYNIQNETALSGPLPDPLTTGLIEVDWFVAYTPAP